VIQLGLYVVQYIRITQYYWELQSQQLSVHATMLHTFGFIF